MQAYGAHIPKIAVMPQSTEDVFVLLDATHTMKTQYADLADHHDVNGGNRPDQPPG